MEPHLDPPLCTLILLPSSTSRPGFKITSTCFQFLQRTGFFRPQHGLAQALIRDSNPLMGGLQLPYLGQTYSFSIERGQCIQILHNGADHWLVASNVGLCETNQVRIYDSMYRRLTTAMQQQIAAIMKTSAPHITVEFVEVLRI